MGKLLIFSAPSGAGKTSLVKKLLQTRNDIGFSISATSRSTLREGEVDGVDYYFMNKDTFKKKIQESAFIEWEEVYKDTFYGTLKSELDRLWSQGKHVVFDIDVQGGLNIKRQFGDRALAIFVMPPSIEVLKQRLKARGSESEDSFKARVDKAAHELTFAPKFDFVIENNELNEAAAKTQIVVDKFLKE